MTEDRGAGSEEDIVRVGPYLVEDVLGTGPHGVVYRVVQPEQGREFALKRLHQPSAEGRPGATFNRVARVVVALVHPVIADVSRIALHGGHVIIVSELTGGRSLARVLEQEGALSPGQVASLAKQLAIGLEYAHQRCVFHTSLRPENIFLMPDGSIRITDFGIAALYGHSVRSRPSYQPRHRVFLAPEFLERGVMNAQTDVFGLGAVLFAALTGMPAGGVRAAGGGRFSYLEVGARAVTPEPSSAPDFDRLPAGTAGPLREAIAVALEPDPSERIGHVNAFQQLLRQLKGAPLTDLGEQRDEEAEVEGAAPSVASRCRLCPACRRPVSPAGRVCLACGLVLRDAAQESEAINYFHEHGRRLLSKRDLGAAERAYERAIQRDPREAQLHNELGDVLAVGNKFNEAADAYREALKLDPEDADAWHDLGVVLAGAHRHREAKEALERAAELAERDEVRLSARAHLGALAAEEGRVGEAIATWKQVLEDDPGLVAVRMALASVYANAGLYEEAEQQLRTVVAAEPGFRQAENLLARVRERAQMKRVDTDERFGLTDDLGGGSTYLGVGFDWGRW